MGMCFLGGKQVKGQEIYYGIFKNSLSPDDFYLKMCFWLEKGALIERGSCMKYLFQNLIFNSHVHFLDIYIYRHID